MMRIFKAKKRTHMRHVMRQGDKAAHRRTRNYPAACQMADAQHTACSKAHEVEPHRELRVEAHKEQRANDHVLKSHGHVRYKDRKCLDEPKKS